MADSPPSPPVPARLLRASELDHSGVVANASMNRERRLAGGNSYEAELGFSPLDWLVRRLEGRSRVAWLDLCCGTGRALIEAAKELTRARRMGRFSITGVDLVPMFDALPAGLGGLELVEASLSAWSPPHAYDLATCVHGLHYLGDKLGLLARAGSWLAPDGLFVANLDLASVRIEGDPKGRGLRRRLRGAGILYDGRRRRVSIRGPGRRRVGLPYDYLGADDAAGPNYTGQAAVDSYYRRRVTRPSPAAATAF